MSKGLIDSEMWKKLFPMYFNMEMSVAFSSCMDTQLSAQFEHIAGIKIEGLMWLGWEQWSKPHYKSDLVSELSARLYLKYGGIDVLLKWKSRSGHIYRISDTIVDCDDLICCFEYLDVDKIKKLVNPIWSLITFNDPFINNFNKDFNLLLSTSFVTAMDIQLSQQFMLLTGIKIYKEICLWKPNDWKFSFQSGPISSLAVMMYVCHNWNDNTIKWKSNRGKIYQPSDEVDPDDIVFWFDDLDVPMVYAQVYPKDPLPFKLKNLTYKLLVQNFTINCELLLELKDPTVAVEPIINTIYSFIGGYNEASEKKDRKMGVVHNGNCEQTDFGLILTLDLGSTGADFLKKLLKLLSVLDVFEEVKIR